MKAQKLLISLSVMTITSIFTTSTVLAQQPVVGRDAAAKYFQKSDNSEREPAENSGGGGGHYLAIHAGKFVSSQAWEWGNRDKVDDTGNYTVGVTYKLDEWANSMDFSIRVDFNEYKVVGKAPLKMSLLPMITFPEAGSQFPLYFGVGAGPGVFFKQVEDESPLTLDYQLLLGVRFFDVGGNAGFFVETGMKNHLQLTTSGQFNGVFLSAGALFTF